METLFLRLVNLSITAGWLVLAVIAVRLIFRRAPRWIFCALWGLVALRLVCPFSIESGLSLIPSAETFPRDILYTARPQIHSGLSALNSAVNPILSEALVPSPAASANPTQVWSFVLSWVWLAGTAVMLAYALVSFLLLRHRMATATRVEGNIRQSEQTDTPFVLGLFRPTIYLPYGLAGEDLTHVIAHERAHICRRDHWWKPLGFVLLSVYWFQPLLWAAYVLLCRDIETACDERVIREMSREDRRGYSTALLNCSIRRRRIAACPLAFGETGVKGRIRRVMDYRRPAFWVVAAALVVCVAVAVCFLTDPPEQGSTVRWVDQQYEFDGLDYGETAQTTCPEFPGVTFRYTAYEVTAEREGAAETLFTGMPVWNVFFEDLNADGLPELCATVSYGSGLVDTHVVVYDYANGQEYTLWERGVREYALRLEGDSLVCDQWGYPDGEVLASGPLRLTETENGWRLELEGAAPPETDGTEIGIVAPGTALVSWQCLFMNPLSSTLSLYGDSGCRYVVGEDYFAVIDRSTGAEQRIDVPDWSWQAFPYTDEEWAALFPLGMGGDVPISQRYEEMLYQPLTTGQFLLRMDGELWLVDLGSDPQMGTYLWSIFSLVPEAAMGSAQWEYAPLFSSRLPVFRFSFDLGYDQLSAACAEGTLVDFNGTGESGHDTVISAGTDLYWSPADGDDPPADAAQIHFSTDRDGTGWGGTLYLTSEPSEDGAMVYTATLVGTGVHLSQNPDGEGAVISLAESGVK